MRRLFRNSVAIGLLIVSCGGSYAATNPSGKADEPPPLLVTIKKKTAPEKMESPEKKGLAIRETALKEAALSYGARSGLSRRGWEINQILKVQESVLEKGFNFTALLIPSEAGLLIEPPMISEAENALLVGQGGQQAAVADKILSIGKPARIVTVAKNWRQYLERSWGEAELPPALLFPKTPEEKKIWDKYLEEGWREGIDQANLIFEMDLQRLTRDFTGMVRYRVLLAQNMVSAPYAALTERGITGSGREMRIGDRALEITGPSQLQTQPDKWVPIDQ